MMCYYSNVQFQSQRVNFEMLYCSVNSVIPAESKVYFHIIFLDFEEFSRNRINSFCTTTLSLVLEVVCD